MRRTLILTLLVLVLVGRSPSPPAARATSVHASSAPPPSGASAGDAWPTYLHDAQRSAANGHKGSLSPATAPSLRVLWRFETGGAIAASPIVVGDTVYVGSWDGYEYALDAASGARRWRTYLGRTVVPVCNPSAVGVTSSATVQDGVVYVGGGDAYWYALDAATGHVLWRVFVGDTSATGGYYNWSSPLLYNGSAYIGVSSFGDCPQVPGQLLRVDLRTHQIVRTFNVVPPSENGGSIWSSPSVDAATNTLYVTTGNEGLILASRQPNTVAIIALDATTLAVKGSWQVPAAQRKLGDSDFGTTPTLFADSAGTNLVAATNKNGILYAFDRRNLTSGPRWQRRVGDAGTGNYSSVAVGAGRLYSAGGQTRIHGVGYPGSIRALDPRTGAVLWATGVTDDVIPALAYADGLVVAGVGPVLEVRAAASGLLLYSYNTGSTIYAAPSIAYGRIYEGSASGWIYGLGLTRGPSPPSPCCPADRAGQDRGACSPTGVQRGAGGTTTIKGTGTGVSGQADHDHALLCRASGNLQITAHVLAQQASDPAAQAGVVVRQSAEADAPLYAAVVTPRHTLLVRYRGQYGADVGEVVRHNVGSLPLYLQIQRVGDQFVTATSHDGVHFVLVPGSTVTLVLPTTVTVGLVVSSGDADRSGTAQFRGVEVRPAGVPPRPPAPLTACPRPWGCADIGNPAPVGGQTLAGETWTVRGGGLDIQGTTDQFHFVWRPLQGDGAVQARIETQTDTHSWAKAGVMLRASTAPSAPNYAAFVTPDHGVTVQFRTADGGYTNSVVVPVLTGPLFLRVVRAGATYTTAISRDGVRWRALEGTQATLDLPPRVLAGLAVTSHNPVTLSSVTASALRLSMASPAR